MKKYLLLLFMFTTFIASYGNNGLPYFKNFTSETYKGQNRNFDILCDDYGTVYVANFEGLLYYDQAEWRIIHTPDISRVIALYKDGKGKIWVGGYNFFGFLTSNKKGVMELKAINSKKEKNFFGEVSKIWEDAGTIIVKISNGTCYKVVDNVLQKIDNTKYEDINHEIKEGNIVVNQIIKISDTLTLYATSGKGVIAKDNLGNTIFNLSEDNGLCSNNVVRMAMDNKGYLWGATDNGIFCISINSPYTHFTSLEGLKGEIFSLAILNGNIYAGTLQGLFVKESNSFKKLPQISQVCWNLSTAENGKLLAATGEGVFLITSNVIKKLTSTHTLSVLPDGNNGFYTGELDGIYYNDISSGKRVMISKVEKVTKLIKTDDGYLWAESMYGQIWCMKNSKLGFKIIRFCNKKEKDYSHTIFKNKEGLFLFSPNSSWKWNPVSMTFQKRKLIGGYSMYPQYCYADKSGLSWITDQSGKNLFVVKDNKKVSNYDMELFPIKDLTIRSICQDKTNLWIGGDFGVLCWNTDFIKTNDKTKITPVIYIRSVISDKGNIIWGGYKDEGFLKPKNIVEDVEMDSSDRNLVVSFSTVNASTFGTNEYCYRLNDSEEWSPWSKETSVKLSNLWYGSYKMQIICRDSFGNISAPALFSFVIDYPVYMKSYAIVSYVILLCFMFYLFFRYRTHRLIKEKVQLEKIVEERTSQLKTQKDEIEEKSISLQKALQDLENAQNTLIRQEKMATIGKLTKNLIDRILNPLNYINNFSRLTQGLANDVEENMKDEESNIDKENYEDTLDVLDMMKKNLGKIEEHGTNASRILKAMEAILQEQSNITQPVDVIDIVKKNYEMLNSYYASDIDSMKIKTELKLSDDSITIDCNAEQLSKTIMSLLNNSVYSIKKKYSSKSYEPIIRLSVDYKPTVVKLHIYDNGMGIEESIVDKIFEPFFTTKTTGEAAGVGLFLSREIVQKWGGDINVDTIKGDYCEFIIELPTKK